MPPELLDPTHFSDDTRDFLFLLHKHGVLYMIVGDEAVIFYGHARLTGDVDIFFDRAPDNAARLYEALMEFWAGDIPGLDKRAELEDEGLILQFGRPPNRIDLQTSIDGVSFETAWPGRQEARIELESGSVVVPYIGLRDLVRNKEASGRPRDLEDLPYLRRAGETRPG